ncbi:MAG: hypothetical protein WA459_25320 [Stellaceae bacterium]
MRMMPIAAAAVLIAVLLGRAADHPEPAGRPRAGPASAFGGA